MGRRSWVIWADPRCSDKCSHGSRGSARRCPLGAHSGVRWAQRGAGCPQAAPLAPAASGTRSLPLQELRPRLAPQSATSLSLLSTCPFHPPWLAKRLPCHHLSPSLALDASLEACPTHCVPLRNRT